MPDVWPQWVTSNVSGVYGIPSHAMGTTTGVWQTWVGGTSAMQLQMVPQTTYATSGTGNYLAQIDQVWQRWARRDCQDGRHEWVEDGTAVVGSGPVWQIWSQQEVAVPLEDRHVTLPPGQWPRTVTEAEVTAQAAADLELERTRAHRRAAIQNRQRARNLRQRVANRKARRLLLEHLSESQRDEYESGSFFHVETAGGARRYRIEYGCAGNIRLVHADELPVTKRGSQIQVGARFCCHGYHPDGHIPNEDHMLAQKFWLESCEDEFLALANVS